MENTKIDIEFWSLALERCKVPPLLRFAKELKKLVAMAACITTIIENSSHVKNFVLTLGN
jgi:hypothetical protein